MCCECKFDVMGRDFVGIDVEDCRIVLDVVARFCRILLDPLAFRPVAREAFFSDFSQIAYSDAGVCGHERLCTFYHPHLTTTTLLQMRMTMIRLVIQLPLRWLFASSADAAAARGFLWRSSEHEFRQNRWETSLQFSTNLNQREKEVGLSDFSALVGMLLPFPQFSSNFPGISDRSNDDSVSSDDSFISPGTFSVEAAAAALASGKTCCCFRIVFLFKLPFGLPMVFI